MQGVSLSLQPQMGTEAEQPGYCRERLGKPFRRDVLVWQRWTVLDPIITVIVAVLIIRFALGILLPNINILIGRSADPVSYTHLRAHETRHDLVCRLLLEKKK